MIFLPALAVLIAGALLVLFVEAQATRRAQIEEARFQTERASRTLTRGLETMRSDLRVLSHSYALARLVNDPGPYSLAAAGRRMLEFAGDRPEYAQIRVLGANGMEIVRVEIGEDGPRRVPDEALQDKFERYYFLETLALREGEIFLSPFDLNVEAGVVEYPVRPAIRIGTPLFDSAKRKRGVLILNYRAERLISRLLETFSRGGKGVMLFNEAGHWLQGGDLDSTWGFMFGRDRSFAHEAPKAWKALTESADGVIERPDAVLAFATVYPRRAVSGAAGGEERRFWKIVKRIPAEEYAMFRPRETLRVALVALTVLVAMTAAASWRLSTYRSERLLLEERMRRNATHDLLTGLPNRLLLEDRARVALAGAQRSDAPSALLFLDLDGFKSVNDEAGHAAGDAVLREVAERLVRRVRAADTVARLGGDEFVVLLSKVADAAGAQQAANSVLELFDAAFDAAGQSVTLGCSIGIALYPEHGEDLAELLKAADRAMYQAKASGRHGYRLAG